MVLNYICKFNITCQFPNKNNLICFHICRNPDFSQDGSWCFVMHEGVLDREMCSIELCSGKMI